MQQLFLQYKSGYPYVFPNMLTPLLVLGLELLVKLMHQLFLQYKSGNMVTPYLH